jgi:hypothetical protein
LYSRPTPETYRGLRYNKVIVKVLWKLWRREKSLASTRIRNLNHLASNIPPPPNRYHIKKKKVNFTLEQAFKVRGEGIYRNTFSLTSSPLNLTPQTTSGLCRDPSGLCGDPSGLCGDP